MRRTILAVAALAAVVAAGSLSTGRAEALPLSTPAAIQAAIDATNLTEDVAYVCRRYRRCGPWGCRWHRECYHTRSRGRRHWRHRRW